MKKYTIILILLTFSVYANGQEVNQRVGKDSLKNDIQLEQNYSEPIAPSVDRTIQPIMDVNVDMPSDADNMNINPKAIEIDMSHPYLPQWQGGGMTGYHGSMTSLTSFRNVAGVNAYQQWGRLNVSGGLSLSKGIGNGIGVVNGMGANVMLGYRLSRNASLHAFGGINRSGWMDAAPDMTAAYYGGYVTLLTNNGKWGVDVGVRSVYNSFTGRWETVPIAMPYYNLNGAKLGIDVGGLLYSVFAGMAEKKNDNVNTNFDPRRGPAIIAPPINTMPRFDPIETPKWVEEQYKGK